MRANRVLIPAIFLLTACSPATESQAQLPEPARVVPTSAIGMKQSFAPVVKRAAPAVVNISTSQNVAPRPGRRTRGP